MSARVRIEIDGGLCVGSGTCVGTAPELFELADGVARARVEEHQIDDDLRDAADGCPVAAIMLRDVESGEPIW